MPELPEVEVLVRQLRPRLIGKQIQSIEVLRPRSIRPTDPDTLARTLRRATFVGLERRGKFLIFTLRRPGRRPSTFPLVGHLGMTGRMYVTPAKFPLPKHVPVRLGLRGEQFLFEDPRYFGRLTLDLGSLPEFGPEPLEAAFTAHHLKTALARCSQAIKVKLLDQTLVAGIGNIYASEALFRARISPRTPSRRVRPAALVRLRDSVVEVLEEAILFGSTLPLNFSGSGATDGLFYFGTTADSGSGYEERLRVYDRANQPCVRCGRTIRRIVQAARSTYYCPTCQPSG